MSIQKLIKVMSLPFILAVAFASANTHAALCAIPAETGNWINNNPNTSGVTRVEITSDCITTPKRTCSGGFCTITYDVKLEMKMRVWGQCHPSDCYWGEVDATYTGANWVRAFYDHGFAERWAWGQVWSGSNNWLRFIVDTDFDSPSREDYRFDEWFVRE